MKVLCLGDVVGNPGVYIVSKLLPDLKHKHQIDFVIANGENSALNGRGISIEAYNSLIDAGVDAITLGNHYKRNKDIFTLIEEDSIILPYNLKTGEYQDGSKVFNVKGIPIRVTSILKDSGEVEVVNEYLPMTNLIASSPKSIHIVDFHGEYTGDKKTFGYVFDGQISAVFGTHTHVQTHDAQILDKGTGFISDLGMCGVYDSILGFTKENVINKIYFGKDHFTITDSPKRLLSGIILEINEQSYLCEKISLIYIIDIENEENSN